MRSFFFSKILCFVGMAVNFPNMIFPRGMEVSGCYVAELDEKVVGLIAYAKKVPAMS